MRSTTKLLFLSTALPALAASGLRAQCQVLAGTDVAYPGTLGGGVLCSTTWDPDGAGPEPIRVVLGGKFVAAGYRTNNIVTYEPVEGRWQALAGGLVQTPNQGGEVRAIRSVPSPTQPGRNDLVVGGAFNLALFAPNGPAGIAVGNVARWNGTAWLPVGNGLSGPVNDLAWDGTTLFAGGMFFPSTATVQQLAGLNAPTWTSVGTGLGGTQTNALLLVNGSLFAGGMNYTTPGISGVARYTAVSGWAPVGAGLTGYVYALAQRGNTVIAGGEFGSSGSTAMLRLAKCDLAAPTPSWSPITTTSAPNAAVRSLAVDAAGDLLVGGQFTAPRRLLGRWDWNANTWSPLGSVQASTPATNAVTALTLHGDVYVGGTFAEIDGLTAPNIARTGPAGWTRLSNGVDFQPYRLGVLPNGNVVAALLDRTLRERTGTNWQSFGPQPNMDGIEVLQSHRGELLAGGTFTAFPGRYPNSIARWSGTAWLSLGNGMPAGSFVHALFEDGNGDLIVGGLFPSILGPTGTPVPAGHIARWNGTQWAPFANGVGSTGVNGRVRAIGRLGNDLVIAGDFHTDASGTRILNSIARWDALQGWQPLGVGVGLGFQSVTCLGRLANGDLLVGGNFGTAGGQATDRLARLSVQGTWTPLLPPGPNGSDATTITAIQMLPNGDALVFGDFTTIGGTPARRVARWNGTTWSAIGPGLDQPAAAVCATANGDVFVGGPFLSANDVSAYLMRLTTTCPATASQVGSGCNGSTGPVAYTADNLPWIGSTFRATATGFGPSSIGMSLVGTTATSIPAASVHPAGLPGCHLLVNPDVQVELLLFPVGGSVHTALSLPNSAALVGVSGHLQVAQIEFDAALAITAISTSNALVITVGAY